jgi:hypothetical protein
MKKISFLVMILVSIITVSCKKDTGSSITPLDPDYYQLKVGNYWVYQEYDIDTNGIVTTKDKWDSAYIEKDTLINGNLYYKLWERPIILMPEQTPVFLRDSSGYLVGSSGKNYYCCDNNFTNILWSDTVGGSLANRIVRMTGRDSVVSVPAGNFQSITVQAAIIPINPDDPHPTRYQHTVYGKSVGKLMSNSFYYDSGKKFEARLVRYGSVTR